MHMLQNALYSEQESQTVNTKKGGVKRILSFYAAAMVALTGCDANVFVAPSVFVVPSEVIQTSKGSVQSCQKMIASVPELAGRRPLFSENLKILPNVFQYTMPQEEALAMLLDFRQKFVTAHNEFVEKEGLGFATQGLIINEGNYRKRWELAIYAPMANFIDHLSKFYPDVYPCVMETNTNAPLYTFALRVVEEFALHHNISVDFTTFESCTKGKRVPEVSFIVDMSVETRIYDVEDTITFDESILTGKLAVVKAPFRAGIENAKSLYKQVYEDLDHLDLSIPKEWKLVVNQGLTTSTAKASVGGSTMTILDIHDAALLQKTISHEYGHMLGSNLNTVMREKRMKEGVSQSYEVKVDEFLLSSRRVSEAIGESFEIWDVIQTDGQGSTFVSQLFDIFRQNSREYELLRDIILLQVHKDSGESLEKLRPAMQSHPKELAELIASAYRSKQLQERLIINSLMSLNELTGKFLAADWSSPQVQTSHVIPTQETCE